MSQVLQQKNEDLSAAAVQSARIYALKVVKLEREVAESRSMIDELDRAAAESTVRIEELSCKVAELSGQNGMLKERVKGLLEARPFSAPVRMFR